MTLLPRLFALSLVALCCLAPETRAKPAKTYTFMLALKSDHGALDRLALRVSSPASGRRGAYVPLGQIERRFGASEADRRAVTNFLRSHGPRGRVRGLGSMVVAKAPAGVAGRLFGQGRRIPASLRGIVTGVAPFPCPVARHPARPGWRRPRSPSAAARRAAAPRAWRRAGSHRTSTSRPTGSRRCTGQASAGAECASPSSRSTAQAHPESWGSQGVSQGGFEDPPVVIASELAPGPQTDGSGGISSIRSITLILSVGS